MVEDARAPKALDLLTRGRDASSRFAGNNDQPHRGLRQFELVLPGHLCQAQGIGRRTEQHGYLVVQEKVQTRHAAHPAPRQAEIALSGRGVERSPEAKERSKRERKEQPVAWTQPDDSEDLLPAVQNPIPAFGAIQPVERPGVGTRSLMQSAVPGQGISQYLAIRRRIRLIRQELSLGGKRQAR